MKTSIITPCGLERRFQPQYLSPKLRYLPTINPEEQYQHGWWCTSGSWHLVVSRCQCFGEQYCLHLQSWRRVYMARKRRRTSLSSPCENLKSHPVGFYVCTNRLKWGCQNLNETRLHPKTTPITGEYVISIKAIWYSDIELIICLFLFRH